MNEIMTTYYPILVLYQALRGQLMEILTDEDLEYTPGGENPPLGVLCREIGEVEQAYIDSFRSFRQDFSYRHPEPDIAGSVARLVAWYAQLDASLKEVVAGLDEEALQRPIERGPDFQVTPHIQLTIYNEALLIFYGKASVYLKAMERERPPRWQHWIA